MSAVAPTRAARRAPRVADVTPITPSPLGRFAARLSTIRATEARRLRDIPARRSSAARATYLGAWARAQAMVEGGRASADDRACLRVVMDAAESLGRLSAGDPNDRRVAMLALGVARALMLRGTISEADFITLTHEWRSVFGANSLR